jgi:hypothetical protein
MEWLSKNLTKQPYDWYNVPITQVFALGGKNVLQRYKDSIADALMTLFPEYDWLPWLFDPMPSLTWYRRSNHYKYIYWLSEKLSLNRAEDWYNVNPEEVIP